MNWSDPASWPNQLPQAGDEIIIQSGVTIVLDTDTPALESVTVEGELQFSGDVLLTSDLISDDDLVITAGSTVGFATDMLAVDSLTVAGELAFNDQDLSISADWIMVSPTGALEIGTEATAFTSQAVLTFQGDPTGTTTPSGLTRGIMVMPGGRLDLHGNPPTVPWTKIDGHIADSATAFNVLDNTGWNDGDELVLAPTDFYSLQQTEEFTIASQSGTMLNVSPAVTDGRWGVLQYSSNTGISGSGLSLSSDAATLDASPTEAGAIPSVLDERAEVGNLTRNILIQSADDTLWQNDGFGTGIMVMGNTSTFRIDGVELYRAGQAGLTGRYPIHWHILSYDDATGAELGDATGQYLRNSAIHLSKNRCVVIHGTNGITVEDNICYDILGHGIFFEDAVERRNLVDGNLILKVRNPPSADALKLHETTGQSGLVVGSSGIWFSNPDNTVTNNTMADIEGFGFWAAIPKRAVGLSHQVPVVPYTTSLGSIDDNTMHSNNRGGLMLDNAELTDFGTPGAEDGRVGPLRYGPTIDGLVPSGGAKAANVERFFVSGLKLWKNSRLNLWNNDHTATFEEVVSADGAGKYFAGTGFDGVIQRSLIIANSLNASVSPFNVGPGLVEGPPTASASYHSTFNIRDNVIIGFVVDGSDTSRGAFATDDFYTRPLEKGYTRHTNNKMINSDPGLRSRVDVNENIFSSQATGADWYVFAGALLDAQGLWGPANNWIVYDQPFFTQGAACTPLSPLLPSLVAQTCDGEYFGVKSFILNKSNSPSDAQMEITVTRRDDGDPNADLDTWFVDNPETGENVFVNMRHFAVHDDGVYLLEFTNDPAPQDVSMQLTNMFDATDTFVLGVEFDGTETAGVFVTSHGWPTYQNGSFETTEPESSVKDDYDDTGMTNLADVIAAGPGFYWQDAGSNIVWIHLQGGLDTVHALPSYIYDEMNVYRPIHLRLWSM